MATIGVSIPWLVTLERQNQPWVLGTFLYEGVMLERGRRLVSTSSQYTYTPRPHSTLQPSAQKTILR